jgi:hypothetical protein
MFIKVLDISRSMRKDNDRRGEKTKTHKYERYYLFLPLYFIHSFPFVAIAKGPTCAVSKVYDCISVFVFKCQSQRNRKSIVVHRESKYLLPFGIIYTSSFNAPIQSLQAHIQLKPDIA